VDTLTTIVFVAIVLVLVAPIVEIAVKRPEIFLELNAGSREFAEAPLRKGEPVEAVAEDREVGKIPTNGSKVEVTHSGELLAA
jgi:hypothetical protein